MIVAQARLLLEVKARPTRLREARYGHPQPIVDAVSGVGEDRR